MERARLGTPCFHSHCVYVHCLTCAVSFKHTLHSFLSLQFGCLGWLELPDVDLN